MIRKILPSAVAMLLLAAPALGASAKYPDLSVTPGKARSDITVQQLCATDWSATERPISSAMRRDVLAEYNLTGNDDPRCKTDGSTKCQIDHLIARKLGGAEAETNLWPQPFAASWGVAAKDKLEDCMHARVCAKLASNSADAATQLLHLYQHDLTADWIAAYRNVIGDQTASCRSL